MTASQQHGKDTLGVEVTNISNHGIWLLTGGKELFLGFDEFPWFKDAPVGKILNVEESSPGHFYWPDLDIDFLISRFKIFIFFLSVVFDSFDFSRSIS
jgi:hypothetical protein